MRWMRCSFVFSALSLAGLVCGCVNAQPTAPATPARPAAPQAATTPGVPQALVPPPATQQPPPVNPFGPQPTAALENFIAFDAEEKAESVTNGTTEAHFIFNLTNISSGDVTINFVTTSCGCTVAKLPSTPWKLAAKDHGEISATMQLGGTPAGGTKTKTLTVSTDKGPKALYVKATVLADPPTMSEMDRTNAQKIAQADRQAVFKDDCIRCHVTPATDVAGHEKLGRDLYVAVCGICHEAEHRASFVPDLHHLPVPTNADFWKDWILHGKPGTLMPAFAKAEGGILSDTQVQSLVLFLTATVPFQPTTIPAPSNLKVVQ